MLVDNAVIQKFPPSFHFDTHLHKTVELLLCCEGGLTVEAQGERLPVEAGDYIAIFPDIPHSTDVREGEPCTILQTHFYSRALSELISAEDPMSDLLFPLEISLGRQKCCRGRYTPQLEACLRGLRTELDAPLKHGQKMAEAYLTQINILLSRDLDGHADSAAVYRDRYLVSAIHFINEHYSEKLTVEAIAAHAGVSPRYLSKLFREQLNIGAAAYLTNVRISQAIAYKHAVPACPLTDLAVDMGFSSLQHFSRVFKEKMGISQKRYFSICQVAL